MSEMKKRILISSEVLTGANNDQTFLLLRRQSPDQRLSSRYNMHDLLSAGFITLTLDKQSKKDDPLLVELPRGFHPVYTSIEYKCASPLYHHTGSSRRTCLKTGRWSGRHVSCSPGESSSCEDLANRNVRLKGDYVRLKRNIVPVITADFTHTSLLNSTHMRNLLLKSMSQSGFTNNLWW